VQECVLTTAADDTGKISNLLFAVPVFAAGTRLLALQLGVLSERGSVERPKVELN